MLRRILFSISICLFLSVFFLYGCGSGSSGKNGKVIATINGEPIYVKDFNRALALNFKRNPMFKVTPQTLESQVNMLIDKRLLIQEAKNKQLDRTDRFVNTIKTFWEQTLIRDLMSYKDNEMEDFTFVREKEIRNYYNKMSHQKTFQVLKSDDKAFVSRFLGDDPALIEWEETIGPISYDDISSDTLDKIFDLPEGEMKILKNDGVYYLFHVKEDRTIPVRPFGEIKSEIEEKIIDTKKQKIFNEWLEGLREKSNVKINKNVLKGVKYGYE